MAVNMGTVTEYFLSIHSGKGYHSFLDDTLRILKKNVILRGGTNQLRSRIIRNTGLNLLERGYDIEFIHGTVNPNNLEGVIIPQLSLSVACGENLSNIKDYEIVNLDGYRDENKYLIYKSKVKDLEEQINVNTELAREELAKLKEIYFVSFGKETALEDRQVLYITEKILKTLFSKEKGVIYHRIAQCITKFGVINYYSDLLGNISNKVYLNEISPSNATGILKIIAREAVIKGLKVAIYFNCLDPEVIELLILPEMAMAIGSKNITGDFKKLISYPHKQEEKKYLFIEELATERAAWYFKEADNLNNQLCLLCQETIDYEGIKMLEKQILAEILKD
ncbi:MAG: hypothetical protein ACOWWO_01505 [Peptococcaceae bacterium]